MTKYIAAKNIVIYADDDIDDMDLVEEACKQYANNVKVITFRDGSQILSYLKSMTDDAPFPCLIILDINMPVLNGKDVLVRLQQIERFNSTPVVLFTTSSMPLDKSFAERYHAGFVTKPLGFEQMKLIT